MADDFASYKRDLPGFPHALINNPLKEVVDFYLEHLRRDAESQRLKPFKFWFLCRGLLLGAMQGYAAVCILLADKRPKRLMLQAGILNRAIFETLVNVSALLEDPARIDTLDREAFKSLALRYLDFAARHSGEEKWKEFLDVYRRNLELMAKVISVSDEEFKNPATISARWPTPWPLIFGKKKQPAWVSGNRQETLKRLYLQHYSHQSELAHIRIAAVSAALLSDNPDAQWNPGHGESGLVQDAAVFVACVVSELQAAGQFSPHPKLIELWTYLRELDEDVKDLWILRYEALCSGKA